MSTPGAGFFHDAKDINVIGGTLNNVGGHYIVNISSGSSIDQSSTLPSLRLPSSIFTGRDGYLERLKKHFCTINKGRKTFLLYGMGGIGKTQVCQKFIEQNKDWFSDIFWIDASSEASIDLRLKQIAKANNVSAESALDWISSRNNLNWLMVFDNADGGYEIVEKFLPPGGHGNILITSRNKELMRIALEENSVEVQAMDEEEAISLLLKSATIKHKYGQVVAMAERIVSNLGHIPLAIDQAGAYIHASGCGLDQYLDIYHKQCRELMSNSSFKGASNYGKSTYGTWEMSMNEIESRATQDSGPESLAAQSAVTLFKYFAFLHYDNISEDIFMNAAENYSKRDLEWERGSGMPLLVELLDSKGLFLNEAGKWDRHQFYAGIQVLQSFSLIKRSSMSYSIHIHPLMHAWSRDRIPRTGVSEVYQMTAALLSCSVQQDRYVENYGFCMQIIPHLRACHAHALKLQIKIMTFFDECDRFAFAFERAGNWIKPEQLYICMIDAQAIKLGMDHLHTLNSMHNLAATYTRQGKLKEAEKLILQVMERFKSKLGSDQPEILATMNSLAIIYHKQGKVRKAEKLLLKVWDRMKARLGVDHPGTLLAMACLAIIYQDQGRWKEAEKLQLQILDEMMARPGANHPDTLLAIHSLAITYREQSRLKEAERLQLQVLDSSMTILGLDHLYTLTIMHGLATTYMIQGRLTEVEELLLKALDGRKARLGADHPYTLSTMESLAVAYVKQGRLKEAEMLQSQVLAECNRQNRLSHE